MKISFIATNPCHLYEWAVALHKQGHLGHYYSGYPKWKLSCSPDFPIVTASWRTLATYGIFKLPESLRPTNKNLFHWQDTGFDRAISRKLKSADFLHGMPGQSKKSFEAARSKGILTVLNHASGPIAQQLKLVEPEYRRAGLHFDLSEHQHIIEQAKSDYKNADFHCAASTIVKEQLIQEGCDAEKIWVIPYGANAQLFPKSTKVPQGPFNICFAGLLSIRKGLKYLLDALEKMEEPGWTLNCYGKNSNETEPDFSNYKGESKVIRHGVISRTSLGQQFHKNHVLVLPSAEEAFGLVVVQALQAGLPCIVSDRVGAKDLIIHRVNGSIFPFGDSDALAEELQFWENNRIRIEENYGWEKPADTLIKISRERV